MKSNQTNCLFILLLLLIRHGVWAQSPDSLLTQARPDMVPLLDSLREISEPEPSTWDETELSEQNIRELRYLRKMTLLTVSNEEQRRKAGQSAWLLGLLYLHGVAVPANPAKAKQLFLLSAQRGHAMASAGLAWCAYDGCQGPVKTKEAQHWTQVLMHIDTARALYFQWLIARQMKPLNSSATEGLKTLTPELRSLLMKAANAGNVHAQNELGILYAQTHAMKEALAEFESASKSSAVAQENAEWVRARMAFEATNSDQNFSAKQVAQNGEALFKLARQFHRGDGVPVNYADAIRLYRQADAAGYWAAHRMLSLIYAHTTAEGTLDAVWMRQLGETDVSRLVPKTEEAMAHSALRRERTALIDLIPNRWLKRQ